MAPRLLVTVEERDRPMAEKEILQLMERVGIKGAALVKGGMGSGIIGVSFPRGDPKECVERLGYLCRADPLPFQHTHRWIPIEEWAEADARHLAEFGRHAEAEIGAQESWRVVVDRHGSPLKRDELTTTVARYVNNSHVDLNHANKTVLLEVVGRRAGMAVVNPNQVLSVDQILQREFVRFQEVS